MPSLAWYLLYHYLEAYGRRIAVNSRPKRKPGAIL